jgi:hypothetical protein
MFQNLGLMLAQAQICFYEKAKKGGMKPLLLAKIVIFITTNSNFSILFQ